VKLILVLDRFSFGPLYFGGHLLGQNLIAEDKIIEGICICKAIVVGSKTSLIGHLALHSTFKN